jgi:8-oxo-dGTP diphosphatase
MAPSAKVRAAGGVVWRRVPSGLEVVLVHRPAYDDWALPKGKAGQLERDEDAALREVKEETGLTCRLGDELPSTTYLDADGRPKVVRYWSMTVVPGSGGGAHGDDLLSALDPSEIDDVRWSPIGPARRRLTYPRDVVVLDAFADLVSRSEVRRQQVDGVLEREP